MIFLQSLIDQFMPESKLYEAYGIIDAQFCDEVLAMRLHGADAKEQFLCDLGIASSFARCNSEAGIVKEGAALEPLPWEARALDGLELPDGGFVVLSGTFFALEMLNRSVKRVRG